MNMISRKITPMMRSCRKFQFWLAIIALLTMAVTGFSILFANKVTEANCHGIRAAMSVEEVNLIFGRAADYQGVEKGVVRNMGEFVTNSDPETQIKERHRDYHHCSWSSVSGTACVIFDRDATVVCRYWCEHRDENWIRSLLFRMGISW